MKKNEENGLIMDYFIITLAKQIYNGKISND